MESLLIEGMKAHGLAPDTKAAGARLRQLLRDVGLPPAALKKYPHEFSGGQRQRIGIARALSVEPKLIVADEPVSALDVSVQAQVINLLEDLQAEYGLTYLVVAHDLAVVRHISDRIGVMYLGGLVEESPADELYGRPLHPYTRALMSAVPVPDPVVEDRRERILLTGDLPSPSNPPTGCRFHTRCPWRQPTRCDTERPQLRVVQIGQPFGGFQHVGLFLGAVDVDGTEDRLGHAGSPCRSGSARRCCKNAIRPSSNRAGMKISSFGSWSAVACTLAIRTGSSP